jgi:cell division transport system permease protein
VQYLSAKEAYQRLQQNLGQGHTLLEGVEPNFLPASLELTLNDSNPEQTRPLLALLSTADVVEEVDYLGEWSARLTSLVSLLRSAGIALMLVICLAGMFIVSNTIRLAVYSRREEIEILQLIGATDRYVRAPFLIEGCVQGILGALLAAGLLFLLYAVTAPRLEQLMKAALSYIPLGFLSPSQIIIGIGSGALLGLVGSRCALGRYLDT